MITEKGAQEVPVTVSGVKGVWHKIWPSNENCGRAQLKPDGTR